MRIVELDQANEERLVIAPDTGRSPGPAHVSNIIRDIENTVLKPGQRRKYDDLSPEEKRRMGAYVSVGWAWEEAIRGALLASGAGPLSSERFISPGECVLDGIYGTPDWLDVDDYCVEEFKATWRSSRRPLDPDFWHWLVQIKAYCKMLGCTWARLRVFYVNGDYRDSGPQIKHFRLEWSKLEIDQNWEMLKNHAKSKGWVK
jgi:hypothetical protein